MTLEQTQNPSNPSTEKPETMRTPGCIVGLSGLTLLASAFGAVGAGGYGAITGNYELIEQASRYGLIGIGASIGNIAVFETSISIKNKLFPQPEKTEREKIIDEFDRFYSANPDHSYFTTNNFIIFFNSEKRIYKKYGDNAKNGPEGLALYLENTLPIIMNHFKIELPDSFQVVRVFPREGIYSLVFGGYHSHNTPDSFSLDEHQRARFSKVYANRDIDAKTGLPRIYSTAIHEAIGHGFLSEALTLDKSGLPLLQEGIATYCEDLISGSDHNDEFRFAMATHGVYKLNLKLSEVTVPILPTKIKKLMETKSFLFEMPLKDAFSLNTLNLAENRLPYMRGNSLIKFIIDNYGVEAFKQLSTGVNPDNFRVRMIDVTGKPLRYIEEGWKESVLTDRFIDNPEFSGMENKQTADESELARKKRILLLKILKDLA